MQGKNPYNTEERLFWSKVDIKGPDDCWEWKASIGNSGYGRFHFRCKVTGSHRVSWTLSNGPIPEGHYILHKCDNKLCCNPNHLYPGTAYNNTMDRYDRNTISFFYRRKYLSDLIKKCDYFLQTH